jgi:hypothetical protein
VRVACCHSCAGLLRRGIRPWGKCSSSRSLVGPSLNLRGDCQVESG